MAARRRSSGMASAEHLRLWRLVEGAVYDAFVSHPEYLTAAGDRSAVASVTKRVVGQLVGNHNEARKRGRSVACSSAAEGFTASDTLTGYAVEFPASAPTGAGNVA